MATGDSADIVSRVKQLLPQRWFAWLAPNRDALLAALSDLAAWSYNWVIYARLQSRLATATGIWLDILCYDFLGRNLLRGGASDDVFRAIIRATILQERVTRAGMSSAVTTITNGNVPFIFEPWNTGDTGAYSSPTQKYGQMGYGQGRGGWGSMQFPAQVFMRVVRGAPGGVPLVGGYGSNEGGYKGPNLVAGQPGPFGALGYVGSYSRQVGLTNQQIEQLITYTKPTGVTVWLRYL